MDLSLGDDHDELRRVARRVLEARCPLTRVRELEARDGAHDADLWREMAGLDWLRLGHPTSTGGVGGRLSDLAALAMEMGRSLAPTPFIPTAVVAAGLLAGDTSGAHAGTLEALSSGERIVVPALDVPGTAADLGDDELTAVADGDGFRLDGVRLLVPYVSAADAVIAAAHTPDGDGVSLFLVAVDTAGLTVERLPNIAGMDLSALRFEGVRVPRAALVGDAGGGGRLLGPVLDRAAALRCAEIVGAGEALLEMSLRYAKEREQFGRPIGQFQAVQQLITDLAIDLHTTSLFLRSAVVRVDGGQQADRALLEMRAFAAPAVQRMVHNAHEVHAGFGFMMEVDVQLYTRRAKHWQFDLGEARAAREALADVVVAELTADAPAA